MKEFRDKIAVVTGGGTGMGRELVVQLAREGAHVAMCDVSEENMAETQALAEAAAPDGTRVTAHRCDVSNEQQVIAFRDAVMAGHDTEHVNLVFNNAGIAGGGTFTSEETREEWERTFGVCWFGVYYCSRAFMPLLVASDEAHLVNTSSVNGFWASVGPFTPHTAYSAAKFAVKGFSEALITDLRLNAPHVKVSVVMPGHIGTSIAINTGKVHGNDPLDMSAEEVAQTRERLVAMGLPVGNESDDQIRAAIKQQLQDFRDNAPMTAAQASNVILDGVRNDQWRILVGDDAQALDRRVRANPEEAYEPSFLTGLQEEGHMGGAPSR